MRTSARRALGALAAALALALSGLRTEASEPRRELTVLAAASLTEGFQALGAAFEARQPGVHVRFSFAGSSTLAAQVAAGAPADVVATADEATMARLADAGLVEAPHAFARNRLEIAVEKGNPRRIARLADLAREDLVVVLAAEQVPVGRYAREALARARVSVTPRSLEPDVRGVLAKVELGEADAGIVYATDVRAAAGRVEGVAIPDAENVAALYPIAVVRSSGDPGAAREFVRFAPSPDGREILARFGFAAP